MTFNVDAFLQLLTRGMSKDIKADDIVPDHRRSLPYRLRWYEFLFHLVVIIARFAPLTSKRAQIKQFYGV